MLWMEAHWPTGFEFWYNLFPLLVSFGILKLSPTFCAIGTNVLLEKKIEYNRSGLW